MSGQDFSVTVASGLSTRSWTDPPRPSGTNSTEDDGAPSRLNQSDGYPAKMLVGTVGIKVALRMTVDGVETPADSTLGGRIFFPWLVEQAQVEPAHFESVPGFSSMQAFTPRTPGHYVIGIYRPAGGAIYIHFDAEEGS